MAGSWKWPWPTDNAESTTHNDAPPTTDRPGHGAAGPVLAPSALRAQIAVSSNDHKTSWANGLITPVPNPSPDTATIIDMNVFPPRILATLDVPGGVSGPPQAVAITP